MLDLQLQYDPNISISPHIIRDTNDPIIAAKMLQGGMMPGNLMKISEISTNFRDAVLHLLITTSDGDEAKEVVQLLSAAVSSTPDDDSKMLKSFSEYLAPLSFAWGETVLATRAVLRNKPESAGNFIGTVASALSKKMDIHTFQNLLQNSTASAAQIVEMEKAQGKY